MSLETRGDAQIIVAIDSSRPGSNSLLENFSNSEIDLYSAHFKVLTYFIFSMRPNLASNISQNISSLSAKNCFRNYELNLN